MKPSKIQELVNRVAPTWQARTKPREYCCTVSRDIDGEKRDFCWTYEGECPSDEIQEFCQGSTPRVTALANQDTGEVVAIVGGCIEQDD